MKNWKKELLSFIEKNKNNNLAFAIDISTAYPRNIYEQIFSIIREFNFKKEPPVIFTDVNVILETTIDKADFPSSARGGTDYTSAFIWGEKNKIGSLVYIADGYGLAPFETKINTLWLLPCDGTIPYNSKNNEKIKWGNFVKI